MRLPQYTDYQAAVQTPRIAFGNDSELARCRPEMLTGTPWARTGTFAYTYRLQNGGKQWAVRCFSKYDPGQRRYDAISRFLNTQRAVFFVPTQYRTQGILVNGRWYPITKTLWVKGQTLEVFIDDNISKRQVIGNLLDQFQRLIALLEDLEVAHGDLQHGNILVSNGKLVLIDYDGMYVPELADFGTEERGHPDYQHPARKREYGPHLDRFSAIVIYLTLRALTLRPELWGDYSAGGDHLMLKQKRDFLSPGSSPALRDLEAIPDLRSLVQRFRAICNADLAQVPQLTDFLSGKPAVIPSAVGPSVSQWGQYKTIAAEHRERLLQVVGQKVTIVGKITDHHPAQTKTGQPYVFLNFGNWRQGAFRLVLWSDAIRIFQARGKNLRTYENQWVSVTGLLTHYQTGNWPARPQIIVSTPSEIEVLAGSEAEARERLPNEFDQQDLDGTSNRASSARVSEYINRGRQYQEHGRHDKAIQEYKAALQITPNYALAHSHLGWTYQQQGRWDDAIKEYETVLQLEPRDAWAWRQLGWAQGNQGRLDRSILAFQSALRIDPRDADAYLGLGWAYLGQGRLPEAIQQNQAALSINPELDMAHNNMGCAYSRQGHLDKAVAEYQTALHIDAANALAHHNLGEAYRVQGRMTEARLEFQKAAQLGHEPAKKALLELGQWQYPRASGDWNEVDVPF